MYEMLEKPKVKVKPKVQVQGMNRMDVRQRMEAENIQGGEVIQRRLLSAGALVGSGIGGSNATHRQAHHKIPNEVFEAAVNVFQPIIIQRINDFNMAWNGIYLPESDHHQGVYFAHLGQHPNYTVAVRQGLAAALAGGLADIFTPAGLLTAQNYVANNLSDNHFRKPGAVNAVAGIPRNNVNGNNKLT